MASKNTNSNSSSVSGNEAGGFRTAAFGFDKNDVTLYIASLRKRMMATEEEYERKLSQAMENAAASSDALKHEHEAILSELEKQWNDKMLESTSTIKNQQERINELERQLSMTKDTVDSLKAQLAAASMDNGRENSDSSVKAADLYMRFAAELRSISDSAQRTLASIEQVWGSELGASGAAQSAAFAAAPVAPVPAPEPVSRPAAASGYDDDIGSLLANDEEDSAAGIVSDLNYSGNGADVPVWNESAPAFRSDPVPKPTAAAVGALDDDFSSLLVDSSALTGVSSFNSVAAAPNGEDLGTELLSDIVVTTGDNSKSDLGQMLREKEENEFEAFKDLFVSEFDPDERPGINSDISITPLSEAEIKPGISTEFDLKATDDANGLMDFVFDVNASENRQRHGSYKPALEPFDKNKEEELFDFSFLTGNDDDDDMSSILSDF